MILVIPGRVGVVAVGVESGIGSIVGSWVDIGSIVDAGGEGVVVEVGGVSLSPPHAITSVATMNSKNVSRIILNPEFGGIIHFQSR